jgi:tetratricopeptide (TPR) repeat protein
VAEGICAGDGVEQSEILGLLGDLVSQSLVVVQVVQERDGAARYRLLETIREYALEKLRDGDEEAMMRDRHLAWFLHLAEEVDAQVWIMVPSTALQRVLRVEADNLRAAFAWSRQEPSGRAELQFAGALQNFWTWSPNEGWLALRNALQRADSGVDDSVRARALLVAAGLAAMQTDAAEAARLGEQAASMLSELGDGRNLAQALVIGMRNQMGDPVGDPGQLAATWDEILRLSRASENPRAIAETLWFRGDMALEQGDYLSARRFLEECVVISRRLGDPVMLAYPVISLARVACAEGNVAEARALAEEGVALRRQEAPDWPIANALASRGEVERCAGEDERAAALFTEALAIFRDLGIEAGIAWSLHNLGHVALRAEGAQRAAPLFAEALTIRHRHRYAHGIASELAAFARLSCLAGDYGRATRLFGAAEALLQRARSVLAPADQAEFERDVAVARTQLGESAFAASWAAGRALPENQAIAEALGGAPMPRSHPTQ